MVSVSSFGAVGDGVHDDSAAFQQALDGAGEIRIPQGCYRIGKTLKIPSGTTVLAQPNARMVMDGSRRWGQGEFLLDNADHHRGNRDIQIIGGIWDGNNRGEQMVKGDIADLTGYSGAVLNFCHVENLVLRDLTVANSLTYNIRMARLDGFSIENVAFLSDAPAHNQDGLHFNGEVRHGRVRNIRALSYGQTNDDLIALNADDSLERVENVGMVRGPIEDITFENLYAENCHTLIRLLSVYAPIRNITITNVYGGFRCYAVNADGARYCRTPLFQEAQEPAGIGCLENVCIDGLCCYYTGQDGRQPAILMESRGKNVQIRDFRMVRQGLGNPAFQAGNLPATEITADGTRCILADKQQRLQLETFRNLELNTRGL